MSITCDQLERALAAGDAQQLEAARAHAASCHRCAETVAAWADIGSAARSMRRNWDSPDLDANIRAVLAVATRRGRRAVWAPFAMAASIGLAVGLGWWALQPASPASHPSSEFLSEQALHDVELSEADYIRAIERLSAVAAPAIESGDSPLLLTRREELLLLDFAIDDCREAIEVNRFNTHLRRELLAMYQAKRRTLEEIINDTKPVS